MSYNITYNYLHSRFRLNVHTHTLSLLSQALEKLELSREDQMIFAHEVNFHFLKEFYNQTQINRDYGLEYARKYWKELELIMKPSWLEWIMNVFKSRRK